MTPRRRRRKTERKAEVAPREPIHRPGLSDGVRPRDQWGVIHGLTEPVLIRFDRKARVFVGTLLLLLALGTAFKLHGSSIGVWNRLFPDRVANAGVLLGAPKVIRIDEWLVATPAIISQGKLRPPFPVVNPRWGPEQVPLIFNWPARHWAMLARPQFWGFFFLDLERAFAFYWNMKAFLLLAGVFLLLMLLTGNDFGVSLLGAAWVFFSGFMQWWYSNGMLVEMIGSLALLLVAVHYLALSSSRWLIGASALVLSLCLLDFTLSFYPPYQVPLFYLGVAILVGSLGPHLLRGLPKRNLAFSIGCAALALSAVILLLALYYRDAKQAIDLMRGTIYPGSRVSPGGGLTLAQVFGGFYGFFMSEKNYPRQWLNVCEASNFVLLFPVPAVALLWRAGRRQQVAPLEWSLIAYLVAVLVWVTVGWPHALAVATAFQRSQSIRSLVGLGLASIFLCCIFLARSRGDLPRSVGHRLIIAGSLVTLLVVFSLRFNHVTQGFATRSQVLLVTLVGAAAGYLLLARKRTAFAVCILVPHIYSYGLVNPLAVGLGPIVDTKFFHQASRLVDQDPNARWIVYAGLNATNLFKAAGAQVFNGTKVIPPVQDLRVLDPHSRAASVYNRYAHMVLVPAKDSNVTFKLTGLDSYRIELDPKSDLWPRLGIRYVVLPFEAVDREFLAKAVPVLALSDVRMWVYRYNGRLPGE